MRSPTRLMAVALCLSAAGYGAMSLLFERTTHERFGWKAEDYFTDPQVIALCHAIEAKDVAEIERLVKVGADVNAQGKDKMTPLMWAFPDNQLPRFKWLLEHGANPNVVVESDFNTGHRTFPGDSVTHMACATPFPGYFDAVFDHGGDPNLRRTGASGRDATPLFTVARKRTGTIPRSAETRAAGLGLGTAEARTAFPPLPVGRLLRPMRLTEPQRSTFPATCLSARAPSPANSPESAKGQA